MKYSETIASKCRYGDVAERIFGEAEILWEHSEDYWSYRNSVRKSLRSWPVASAPRTCSKADG